MSNPQEESQRDTKIIAVGSAKNLLGRREKNDRERAWEAVAGRDKFDERMRAVDLLFSEGGLKKLGLGDKTIAGLVASGALAYWQGYIKSTVGAGGLRDISRISTKNEKALSFGLAKYQRFKEARTRRNNSSHLIECKKTGICIMLGHPSYCPGKTYGPGDIMFDGQDSEYVKGLALQVLRVMAHQICKSFSVSDMETQVLAPEENKWPIDPTTGKPMMPGWNYNQGGYPTDNFSRRPPTVTPAEPEPAD